MEKILKGIVQFSKSHSKSYLSQLELAKKLGGAHTVMVSCVDSRLNVEQFLSSPPGDMFVVRNAGNFIPAYERDATINMNNTVPAVIDLGCNTMEIKNVVVCGHSDCKAVVMLRSLQGKDGSCKHNSPLASWVTSNGHPTVHYHFKNIPKKGEKTEFHFNVDQKRPFSLLIDPEKKLDDVDVWSQVNTLQQMANLERYPLFSQPECDVKTNAIWFDITSAKVLFYSRSEKKFVDITAESVDKLAAEA